MLDNDKVDEIMMSFEENLEKAINSFKEELASIRAGRANPHTLDKVLVDYYGTMTPINQVGNITVPEARMIVVSPWDASMLPKIEKGILAANIGLNPSNDGKVIRLIYPELTEERRKDLVKQTKKMTEDRKVVLRNARRDSLDKFKKMKTDKELSDDEYAGLESDIDKLLNGKIELLDSLYKDKEKEILSV